MNLSIESLTPGEVAEVTGVSLDNQRNLRRAGYLPKNKGHARFGLVETCRLRVIGLLSERGIGPKVAVEFADTAARGIFLSILNRSQIYTAEAAKAAFDATRVEADAAVQRVGMEMPDEMTEENERFLRGTLAKEHLAEVLAAQIGARGERVPKFFVYWGNGHPEFFYGDQHPFEDVMFYQPAWQGAAIMLCLPALAYEIAGRLPRPIVTLAKSAE